MTRSRSSGTAKMLRTAVVTVAVTALAVTSGAAANAQQLTGGTTPSGNQLAPNQDRSTELGEATLLAALQRDLDLTEAQAQRLLAIQDAVVATDVELQEELGDAHVESRFDAASGTLTVAVTDAAAAEQVVAAGAEAEVVGDQVAALTAITEELDALAESDPAAVEGIVSWGVDLAADQVVVTVVADQVASVESVTSQFGSAVQVETTEVAPSLTQDLPYLDGGLAYNTSAGGCSTGFNMRTAAGQGYVLTAGHCHAVGLTASAFGQTIGPVAHRNFPGADYAAIRVTNSYWIQGPWVWTYPGFTTIVGNTNATTGTAVCSSGRTTGLTCGTITATGQSVNFGGTVVNNLIRHSACVRQGDSGGPTFTSNRFAVGTNTGAQLAGGQCVSPPVSWSYPTTTSLSAYSSLYGASLLTG